MRKEKSNMKKLLLAFAIIAIAFSSCKKEEKEEPLKPLSEAIIGTWNVPSRVTDGTGKFMGLDVSIKEEVINSKIKATFKADGTFTMAGEYQSKTTFTAFGTSETETTDEFEETNGNFKVISNTQIEIGEPGEEYVYTVTERTNNKIVLSAEGEEEVDGETLQFKMSMTLTK